MCVLGEHLTFYCVYVCVHILLRVCGIYIYICVCVCVCIYICLCVCPRCTPHIL